MDRKVGIYARVSKAEANVHDTTSIPVQLADCRAYADEQGWTVVQEYVDEGISAWDKRKVRPAYKQLLADVETGLVEVPLARDTERLLRQDKDGAEWLKLYERGIISYLAFADEADIDLRRARDRKDFKERVASAVYYSERLSEKIKSTKRARRAAGYRQGGGRRPFGYDFASDGGLTVRIDEAEHIRDAVHRLTHGMTPHRVVMDWNATGLRTPYGNRWSPSRLERMLAAPVYLGGANWEAILSKRDQDDALRAWPKTATVGRPAGRRYPVTGLVFCSECGLKLLGSSRSAYRCTSINGGCGKVSIKAYPLERYLVVQALLRPATDNAATEPTVDTGPILEELRAIQGHREEVVQALADRVLPVDAAGAAIKQDDERIAALREQLARLSPSPATPTPSIFMFGTEKTGRQVYVVPHIEGIDPMSPDFTVFDPAFREAVATEANHDRWKARELTDFEVAEMHDFLASQIERVTIKPVGRGGLHIFNPRRVRVTWRAG